MTEIKREPPDLVGERVRLRPGRPEDAASVVAYFRANLERLQGSMPKASPRILEEEHWREQFAIAESDRAADRAVKMFVLVGGAVSGTVNFSQIARGPSQSCVLGYGIARELEGKGHMTEALGLALAYAFGPLGLHRVEANYRPTNARSGRLLRKLGFVVEGYSRDYLFLDGRWEDHVRTALFAPGRAP